MILKKRPKYSWWLQFFTILSVVLFGTLASGAEPEPAMTITAGTAEMPAPAPAELSWSSEIPMLTAEQQAQMAFCQEKANRPGPRFGQGQAQDLAVESPNPITASFPDAVAQGEPQGPDSARLFRKTIFPGAIPAGYKSNVMESSVGLGGKFGFYTGNWFGARTTTGGTGWTYVNAFNGFPSFCCDQIAIYDESRDLLLWLRMGVPDANGENVFRLDVSRDGGATWYYYQTSPKGTNATWVENWWDYPHIQLGADYLYIAWNMFSKAGNWTRTVMLKWPLDALLAGSAFGYSYFPTEEYFTFVPVQGSRGHVMYWASNWPVLGTPDRNLRIYRWYEDSGSISSWTKTLTPWSPTYRGEAVCGNAQGNWAARYDQRVLTGSRYFIQNSNLKIPGRAVLAWWWNVKQGGGFTKPYIEAAAFYEDTMEQVGGLQGRPFIWNSSSCAAYPSAAANKRGDLGLVFNWSSGTGAYPSVYYSIADNFTIAPPGFVLYQAAASSANPPDNKWGDYNTCREYEPTQKVWVGASHVRSSGVSESKPVFFVFGRDRDFESWDRWKSQ